MKPMQHALVLARAGQGLGEVPIGCVITDANGHLIASAHNEVESARDATHHAELIAIQRALAQRGDKYLDECILYVTLEPCAMCAGAIASARLGKLIFGAYDPKSGGVEHNARVFTHAHHKPEIIGGILENECAELMTNFFKEKR